MGKNIYPIQNIYGLRTGYASEMLDTKLLKSNFLNIKYLILHRYRELNINDLLSLKNSLRYFKLYWYHGPLDYEKFNEFTKLNNLTLWNTQPRNISGLNIPSLNKLTISICFENLNYTTDNDIDLVKFTNQNNLSMLKELEINGIIEAQIPFILP